MKSMKRWIAAFLTVILFTQAFPVNALAGTGDPITEEELQRALQIAGLQVASGSSDAVLSAGQQTDTQNQADAGSDDIYSLEAVDSGYHKGMKPDENWDAQMLLDWLDDIMDTELYNVVHVYSEVITRLEQLETEDPAAYARLTGPAYSGYMENCRDTALFLESAEQEARLFKNRVEEYMVIIQHYTEIMANARGALFDTEIARYSEQIRNAAEGLDTLRAEIVVYGAALLLTTGMLSGNDEYSPEYKAWINEILSMVDPLEVRTGKLSAEPMGTLASATRVGRMTANAGTSVLAGSSGSNDFTVQVMDKNQFAIVIKGENNQPVVGVSITLKDQNGKAVVTKKTENAKLGSAVFNCADFVVDYDQEMELSMTVDGTAVGYRSYYIPWFIMRRGGIRTEVLTKLTDPTSAGEKGSTQNSLQDESVGAGSSKPPYVYSCMFNNMDIKKSDKVVMVSTKNDYDFDFVLEVENPGGGSYQAPVLHYVAGDVNSGPSKKEMGPTSTEKVTATRTKYIYRAKWKKTLYPRVSEEDRPYFVFPSTGEKITTQLTPKLSKVDQPVIAGTEVGSPLQKVFGNSFGFNFELPQIGGTLGLNIPIASYLPTVRTDVSGYITVTFGSSLVDPEKTTWQNTEQERYDKGMKQYEHNQTVAGYKQKLGTAYKYYKYMWDNGKQHMSKIRIDLGWFLMLSGRAEGNVDNNGATYWNAGGCAGLTFVYSFDLTQPLMLGPVPFYANVNIGASVGIGLSLTLRALVDNKGIYRKIDINLSGLSIQIRLWLTVSIGVGIKGIASIWVAATGALNIIMHFMAEDPVHIAIYGEFSVSVGFEFFFITYSKQVWKLPTSDKPIWSNYDAKARQPFSLFLSYAKAEETGQKPDVVQYTPEKYPQLAPAATELEQAHYGGAPGKIEVVNYNGYDCIFTIPQGGISDERNLNYFYVVNYYNCGFETSRSFGPVDNIGGSSSNHKNWQEYDFDVYNDGKSLHLVVAYAKKTDLVDGQLKSDATIKLYYVRLDANSSNKYELDHTTPIVYEWRNANAAAYNLSSTCFCPKIESVVKVDGKYEIYGTLKGDSTGAESQFNLFYILPERNVFKVYGNGAISYPGDGMTEIKSFLRSADADFDHPLYTSDAGKCPGNIALVNDWGDTYLLYYDYTFDLIDNYDKNPVRLAEGKIKSFELLQTLQSDQKSFSQTIFYTIEETVGDRVENRLKGIYIAPRDRNQRVSGGIQLDLTMIDYDLSLPVSEFRTATIGTSQYLYWITNAPKEKETDQNVWRISGVYYDSKTRSFSDEMVIAEFSLPDIKVDGKAYKAVPEDVTLAGAGVGYLIARPNTGKEKDTSQPARIFRFKTNLKGAATLKGVTVTDNVVHQGDFVSADMSLMNEGNMGIGGFTAQVVLTETKNNRVVEKEVVETIYANLVNPKDSKIVMKDGTQAAKGEQAIYRLKDFVYSTKQHEWIVQSRPRKITVLQSRVVEEYGNTANQSVECSNVLQPGTLGGYTGNIKIPNNWSGVYDLRLKITNVTTYSNYLSASSLAEERPELFAMDSDGLRARASSLLLGEGILRLDYELDETKGKMVVRKECLPALYMASAAGVPSLNSGVRMLAQNAAEEAGIHTASDENTILLYDTEMDAPEPVDIQVDVHDIDVSHRVYTDYYGEEMLEITIHNYFNNSEPIRLYCTVYEDDATTGRNFNLPHDQESITAHKTQTITLPLASMVDMDKHEKIRVVIKGVGINNETAGMNNEFEVYLGSKTNPEPTEAPTVVPVTGDSARPVLWIALILLGAVCLAIAGGLFATRKKKERN